MTAGDPYADIDFGPPDEELTRPTPIRHPPGRGPIRSRLLTISQMANLPDPDPLIRGTIDLMG